MNNRIADLMELIGWQLKKKRELKNITQEAVAKDAGVPLAGYQQMETAKRRYRIDTFLRVLQVFNLDIMRALETPQPARTHPKHEVLHEKLEQLLQAGEPWRTVATYNVEGVFMKYKSDQKS